MPLHPPTFRSDSLAVDKNLSAGRAVPGFTLLEIVIVVFILIMLLGVTVPSLTGVIADRRLHAALDRFNDLVHQAQERSVAEHRSYLLVWEDSDVVLRPEVFGKDEEKKPVATFPLERGSTLVLHLPAALVKKPPGEWIFWATGNCEPAIVQFEGRAGKWTVNYSPLTAHAEISNYVAR